MFIFYSYVRGPNSSMYTVAAIAFEMRESKMQMMWKIEWIAPEISLRVSAMPPPPPPPNLHPNHNSQFEFGESQFPMGLLNCNCTQNKRSSICIVSIVILFIEHSSWLTFVDIYRWLIGHSTLPMWMSYKDVNHRANFTIIRKTTNSRLRMHSAI